MNKKQNTNKDHNFEPGGHPLLDSNVPGARPSGMSILLEFKNRRLAGEKLSARQFVLEPHVPNDPELIVDIAFVEYLEAEKQGEASGVIDRLCKQFPEHAPELRRQVDFHQALSHHPESSPNETTDESSTYADSHDSAADQDTKKLPGSAVPSAEPSSTNRLSIPGLNLLKPLGRGGMGVVYLAHQPKLNRKVAVKLLLAGAFASSAVQRGGTNSRFPSPSKYRSNR
ncbi:MAG: hypothetical protein ABL888_04520 [Pirellulaceae bacterium]